MLKYSICTLVTCFMNSSYLPSLTSVIAIVSMPPSAILAAIRKIGFSKDLSGGNFLDTSINFSAISFALSYGKVVIDTTNHIIHLIRFLYRFD